MRLLTAQRAAQEEEDGRQVVVADLATLQASVQAHEALRWDSRLRALAGQTVTVRTDDPSDGTSQVRFGGLVCWLPTEVLRAV